MTQIQAASIIGPLLPEQLRDDRKPTLEAILTTDFGNIGWVQPDFAGSPFKIEKKILFDKLCDETEVAAKQGAKLITYIGKFPEATGGLVALEAELKRRGFFEKYPAVKITTGHKTEKTAFKLDIEKIRKAILLGKLYDATELAAKKGAKTISYTGMFPAATDGLVELEAELKRRGFFESYPDVKITTGHETVTAAFMLNIETICDVAHRDINKENITLLGLGHLGTALLKLIFALGHRPPSLTLVDLEDKKEYLEALKKELKEEYNYPGEIKIILSQKDKPLPDEFYTSSRFFLTASSTANIVKIDKLQPGSIIVDDSAPTCFNEKEAVKRINQKGDILITTAGALASKAKIEYERIPDPRIDESKPENDFVALLKRVHLKTLNAVRATTNCLASCVYSAVLGPHFNLPLGAGKVKIENALQYYKTYKENGFVGTVLHFFSFWEAYGSYIFKPDYIQKFKDKFGYILNNASHVKRPSFFGTNNAVKPDELKSMLNEGFYQTPKSKM